MAVGEISRWGLEQALNRFEEVGRAAFLGETGFGESTHYFVTRGGRRYDSKPVMAWAWHAEHPEKDRPGPKDFSGGMGHAVARLLRAGADLVYVDERTLFQSSEGSPIDASFGLEGWGQRWEVVLHSRGGAKGTPQARNTEYALGLRVVLGRLALLNGVLVDAAIDSKTTADQELDDRRLALPYPLALDRGIDTEALGAVLQRRQSEVAKTISGAKGGNPTRRIRLWVELPSAVEGEALRDWLRSGGASELFDDAPYASDGASREALEATLTDLDRGRAPKDDELGTDSPRRKQQTILRIERNARLRDQVKARYDHRCQRCEIRLEAKLGLIAEAAHIHAVGVGGADRLGNLLCLCPNCHAMFDRGGWWLNDGLEAVDALTGRTFPLTVRHEIDLESVRRHRAEWER
jgi:hypothetical protein